MSGTFHYYLKKTLRDTLAENYIKDEIRRAKLLSTTRKKRVLPDLSDEKLNNYAMKVINETFGLKERVTALHIVES